MKAWRCSIDARLLWRLFLDVSRATVGSWLSLLTLSCLTRNKQSSQLIGCQALFETISTHAPLKHARPIKRQGETNGAVQLSSEQNEALPGASEEARGTGCNLNGPLYCTFRITQHPIVGQVTLLNTHPLAIPTNHTFTFTSPPNP